MQLATGRGDLEMRHFQTPEKTLTCKQAHGTCPERDTRVSASISNPHLPLLQPRAKSASHMLARATFPNNGKQVGGKAGSARAMAACQRRAQPVPEAASCPVSTGAARRPAGSRWEITAPRRAAWQPSSFYLLLAPRPRLFQPRSPDGERWG